jgi:hypothetical protein
VSIFLVLSSNFLVFSGFVAHEMRQNDRAVDVCGTVLQARRTEIL